MAIAGMVSSRVGRMNGSGKRRAEARRVIGDKKKGTDGPTELVAVLLARVKEGLSEDQEPRRSSFVVQGIFYNSILHVSSRGSAVLVVLWGDHNRPSISTATIRHRIP